ncbi:MAG: multidrug ABC transporter ATP-binding protein [Candidatus Glassbacteria bacterium RBG_16_58_8]|uniref:Multidrug ABC transporter ATP-binding protein n=1 Tax=Candidatus Glassbacteria bacterium RBG_16_58_8 TaxID=1817866 RepID=A0A1F5YBZ4_9BACT|nr:MAG: multidrug ABC transporter ATP-binding protein [Candidatus Glassbacteria bacterium RBG_16_58_8]
MNGRDLAIVVNGLSRKFGDIRAVEDLTFSVQRGELFGLLGPDGAGKTTTLRMLAGILKPSAGDAAVNGKSVVREPEAVKHEIAYMSQRFGLYTDLTVLENITFYADLYLVPFEERPARIERLFAFSNLGQFQDRLAGALSGGMKQKLGLSCALIHQPSVLLLDEPTFGVDPVSRRDLWMIIHEMVGQGTTVLASTSYMDEAERFDRLAMLDRGRLRALDTPDSLREKLEVEIVAVTTGEARQARSIALEISGVLNATVFGGSLHLAVASAGEMAPKIHAELTRRGIEVLDIRSLPPGMEDVFIDYTTRSRRNREGGEMP